MKTKFLKPVALALSLFLLGSVAYAEPDSLVKDHVGGGRAAKLRALHDQFEGRRQDVVMRLSQRRLELAQLLRRDDVDKGTIKSKIAEILDLERQRQELFVDEFFEAKTQLNQKQFGLFRQKVLRSLIGGNRAQRNSANEGDSR